MTGKETANNLMAARLSEKSPRRISIVRLFEIALIVSVLFPTNMFFNARALAPVPNLPSSIRASFEWKMDDRYWLDRDGDGMIDYNYSLAYLNPEAAGVPWTVRLNASSTVITNPPRCGFIPCPLAYDWNMTGPGSVSCNSLHSVIVACEFSKQGDYNVTLTVRAQQPGTTPALVPRDTVSQKVTVKELLMVSIGDSIASGEGNPQKRAAHSACLVGSRSDCIADLQSQWASDWQVSRTTCYVPLLSGIQKCSTPPQWQDQRCHRSSVAGPSLAAKEIEQDDPHTSVTFLHLACSGAGIFEGLIGPYVGQEPQLLGFCSSSDLYTASPTRDGRTFSRCSALDTTPHYCFAIVGSGYLSPCY